MRGIAAVYGEEKRARPRFLDSIRVRASWLFDWHALVRGIAGAMMKARRLNSAMEASLFPRLLLVSFFFLFFSFPLASREAVVVATGCTHARADYKSVYSGLLLPVVDRESLITRGSVKFSRTTI